VAGPPEFLEVTGAELAGGPFAHSRSIGSRGAVGGRMVSPPDFGHGRALPSRASARRSVSCLHAVPLLWRIFVGNAIVLGLATTALVLTPVTVSFPAAERELLVLAAGLAVMLLVNYLLLKRAVSPLRRLVSVMGDVDPLNPGRRAGLPDSPAEVAELGGAFDAMLDRLERERRDSARRALGAQEDERLRIARELHDEVGQSLTAVVLQLDRAATEIGDGPAADRVRDAREAARATLEEVRAIARNLRPEALDDLGLAAALRQLCVEAERTGLLVDRRITPGLRLGPDAEVVVYRVAQEAVTNVLRHARAERIWLTLHRDGDSTILRVQDDGCGVGGAPPGGGVRGMRERALLVGGTLEVTDAHGGGTAVTLRLP
jgi:two-component system, NarL family, sensor histidine kinase UhpB